jgi:hypothetical protein
VHFEYSAGIKQSCSGTNLSAINCIPKPKNKNNALYALAFCRTVMVKQHLLNNGIYKNTTIRFCPSKRKEICNNERLFYRDTSCGYGTYMLYCWTI